MDIGTISLVLMLALIGLLAIGMPLGLASAALAVLVLVMKFEPALLLNPMTFGDGMLTSRPGTGALYILAQKIYGLLTDYVLISVPLFIFMASLLERSGIAKDMYSSLNVWLSRTRGGIAIVTSIMAVIMAAMSGIIGGEVVLLGLIALPQMLRLGYNQNLAIGVICASGSLGTMIPPSIVLIIYGLITETSIKALFTAAFVPGFMLASMIILYIIVRTQLRPEDAPLPEPDPNDPEPVEKRKLFGAFMSIVVGGFATALFIRALFFELSGSNAAAIESGGDVARLGTMAHIPWLAGIVAISLFLIYFVFGKERSKIGWDMGKGLVAPMVVIGVVLGSIYGGITGITEAAGMGAFAVLIIAILRGEGSFELVWDSLMRTLKSTGTIIWVTIGAAALAGAYTIAGGPQYVADLIVGKDLPTMAVILMMMLILLFMGAFMDWVGIVLLIIPVFLPIVLRLPIDEIGFIGELQPNHVAVWFGVVFCMNMQVSFLSPPFGPAAFYLKSVAPPHISLTDIFKGFLPFIGIQLMALSVLLIWPNIIAILL
ncbi:MAG: TRAP transporter large permease subunit [Planktotalea sp.]|jgi:TRAP-type mannitol/chloroaromatic compound transport system permease large subunit|uniref:TRAP transporter large permease n=1 Tax=Planktotalea sp. TaxID=2029877 RepID=UPI000183BBAF|nr:TRAP transporter large permease subunit [Planktotalea sp.]EDZ44496.1 trap dicarboxylate transporter, dctm subunit [Rhodobacteraceae bacterium HTCC2083]MBT5823333.1 TRAP transporter large permease subunit [Paracoccaceae bacterium]MDG1076093.1 TRAP transporter large permease subunit [Planktotalea sp.]MDG1083923.1 TRAP transporter large permease subunit [Planktotalea sp.]HCW85917.1 C4-dicarboxylate ABC transporter permease [Paracoccaceae bacterium]